MPVYKVKVKWGKENYPDVELNTDEEPVLFKAQLFALTGVQPDRQKVMFKGKTINDNSWDGFVIKEGAQLLMMGTADPLPEAPTEKVVFMEDMNHDELASALELPAGLTNLGNTCYLNATIQCLRTVPELKDALLKYSGAVGSGTSQPGQMLTAALRDVYESMDKSATITPLVLVQVLHMIFPRFAEKSEHGGYMQQDANECWTELMRMLQQKLSPQTATTPPAGAADAPAAIAEASASSSSGKQYSSFVDQYFGGSFHCTMKNSESADEPVTVSKENFLQLSCFISQDIKYMQSGLNSRLIETITKKSELLGRDCQYAKSSKISRLPAYLTIQFVRFFYKENNSTSAKILKDIKFPMQLDVFELCSEDLQQKLLPMRNLFKEIEDKKVDTLAKGGDIDKKEKVRHPFSFADDQGSNNSGLYELQAVLTHKGRSSSSGHYVAWVRRKADEWFKCDDDYVSVVSTDEILKLSGGGDWHTAYVLLYGPRILETSQAE